MHYTRFLFLFMKVKRKGNIFTNIHSVNTCPSHWYKCTHITQCLSLKFLHSFLAFSQQSESEKREGGKEHFCLGIPLTQTRFRLKSDPLQTVFKQKGDALKMEFRLKSDRVQIAFSHSSDRTETEKWHNSNRKVTLFRYNSHWKLTKLSLERGTIQLESDSSDRTHTEEWHNSDWKVKQNQSQKSRNPDGFPHFPPSHPWKMRIHTKS